MKKQLPPRPEKDFTVCSIAWDLEIVQRHTKAGFVHIPDPVVYRRFFQFLDFLQRNSLTVRIVAASLSEVTPDCALCNSDLTDHGFRFVQLARPRWAARLYKDRGQSEFKFLERWFRDFSSKSNQ